MRTHPRHGRRQRGFTITEVLVTTALVGTAFVATSWLTTSATRSQETYKRSQQVDTLQLAREIREMAMALRNEELAVAGPASLPEDIVALDSLDGATFSPPLRADGSVMTHLSGWSQRIDLSTAAKSNMQMKLSNTLAKPAKGSGEMYKLEVTIVEGVDDVASYEWWIKP